MLLNGAAAPVIISEGSTGANDFFIALIELSVSISIISLSSSPQDELGILLLSCFDSKTGILFSHPQPAAAPVIIPSVDTFTPFDLLSKSQAEYVE